MFALRKLKIVNVLDSLLENDFKIIICKNNKGSMAPKLGLTHT